MTKNIITVDNIPAAGPYSQAVEAGPFIFCSGQIPVDPKTGKLVVGDIGAATEQVLTNLQSVLSAAGLRLEHVVKTTVYLTDMEDFPAMNEVYSRYFPEGCPARSTVQVAGLPKGAAVEIDAVALRP